MDNPKLKQIVPPEGQGPFPIGQENIANAAHFTGRSYLHVFASEGIPVYNVTFEPGCRNHWHRHRADSGGGQLLICTAGRGWYQEWGRPAQPLKPGETVVIRADVKHWHGAAKDSWLSHIAVSLPGENTRTEWLEPLPDEEYALLP